MAFDPYHKWLGITPSEQPANHYRLLSLQLFESDADIVSKASERQFALVKSFAEGEYRAHAVNLLREIVEARGCLLDPERKSAYDAVLNERSQTTVRSVHGSPIYSHAQATARVPVSASAGEPNGGSIHSQWAPDGSPSPELPPRISVTSPNRQRRKRSSAARTFWLIVSVVLGGMMGICAGYFLLCVYHPKYDFLNLLYRTQEEQAVATDSIPSTEPRPLTRATAVPERRNNSSSPRRDPFIRKEAPLAKTSLEPKRPPRQPTPAAAKPKIGVPDKVDLPPLAAKDDIQTLGHIEIDDPANVSLKLKTLVEGTNGTPRFTLNHSESPNLWTVHFFNESFGEPIEVAQFVVDQETISFQWTSQDDNSGYEQLRNGVLEIQIDDQKQEVLLRKPVMVEPLTIDLDKPKQLVVGKCDAPPSRTDIRVEIGELENFPRYNIENGNLTTLRIGDERILRYQSVPEVACRCRLLRRGSYVALEIQHHFTMPSMDDFVMTISQVNKKKHELERKLNAVSAAIKAVPKVESYLNNLRIEERKPQLATRDRALDEEIRVYESRLIELKALAAELPKVQTDMKALTKIADLGNQIHNTSKIHFRFYTVVGDRDVDLVLSDPANVANAKGVP
jgi:hypothetical protein